MVTSAETTGSAKPKRRRMGPSQSPVVPEVVTRIRKQRKASLALRWGAFCFATMVLILLDMYYRVLSYLLGTTSRWIWFGELAVLVCLFLAVLYDFTLFLGVMLFRPSVKLTESQKKMLGVKNNDFKTVSTPVPFGEPLPETPASQSLSPIATPFSTTPLSTTPLLVFRTPTGSVHSTPSYAYTSSLTPNRSQSSLGPRMSPFSSERITSLNSLEQYLQTEEEREQRMPQGSPDLGFVQSQGSWQAGGSACRKYRVATGCLSFAEDEDGREGDSIWPKLGISGSDLNHWTERCRQWLAQTVLAPVAAEIDKINKSLQKIGCSDVSIGQTPLAQLREVARFRTQHLPSLGMMLRYLDLTTEQSYLVKRVQELACGGCIGTYRWSASPSKDKNKPSDAEILIHFFCTYMDSQIPPSPQYHDGRTFSDQFLLKTPLKPANKKADVCLYQTSSNPAHFKVIVRESTLSIPKGRYNLFHALVAFLYHIKTKENGLLGQLDLGLLNINIFWIVSD